MTTATTENPPKGRRAFTNSNMPYYLGVVALTAGGCFVVGEDLGPTTLAVIIPWFVFTISLRPPREVAGRGFGAALTAALLLRNYAELEPAGRFWALLTLAILAVPFALRPMKRTTGFPIVHLWCLIEGMYVYVSALFARPPLLYATTFSTEIRTTGYRTLSLFCAVLVASALVLETVLSIDRTAGSKPTRTEWLSQRAIPRAYVIVGIGSFTMVVLKVTRLEAALGSISFAITCAAFGGWLILVALWLQNNLPSLHKLFVIGLPVVWAFVNLGSGALYQTAYPGFFVLALFMSMKRRVPWAGLAVAIALLTVLNVQKGEVRNDVRSGEVGSSALEVSQTWLDRSRADLGQSTVDEYTSSAWRFGNSDLLGYITTNVPSRYGYFGAEPYTTIPYVLIPRVILPDKPAFNFENEFGRRYELIGRSDYETTVNTPLHVEAMAVGGYPILVAVALFVGVAFALLQQFFRKGRMSSQIVGALIAIEIILSVESGMLSLLLIVPYSLFLLPIMTWGTPIDEPVGGDASPARAISS